MRKKLWLDPILSGVVRSVDISVPVMSHQGYVRFVKQRKTGSNDSVEKKPDYDISLIRSMTCFFWSVVRVSSSLG